DEIEDGLELPAANSRFYELVKKTPYKKGVGFDVTNLTDNEKSEFKELKESSGFLNDDDVFVSLQQLPTATVKAYNTKTTKDNLLAAAKTLNQKFIEPVKTITGISGAQEFLKNPSDHLSSIGTAAKGALNRLTSPLPYSIPTPKETETAEKLFNIADMIPFLGLGSRGVKTAGRFLTKSPLNKMSSSNTYLGLSDVSKSTLKEVKPFANRYENIIETNPLTQSQAYNLRKQNKANELFSNFIEGSTTIDNFVKDYSLDLSSPEGIKRLINQEFEYLQSKGVPNFLINPLSKKAAKSRLKEIKNIRNKNKQIADGLINSQDVINDSYNFNNASFNAYKNSNFIEKFIDNKFKKLRDIKKSINYHPGLVGLGTGYQKNIAAAAHEIAGHGLQSGRVLPIDNRLRKRLDVDINSLNKSEKKSYNYFLKGSNKKEPSGFAQELRESMLQAGLIKNRYDYISPKKIEIAKKFFEKRPFGTFNKSNMEFYSSTKILDFMKPNKSNYTLISKELNKLPALVPAVGAATGAIASQQQYRNGGLVGDPPEKKKNKYFFIGSDWHTKDNVYKKINDESSLIDKHALDRSSAYVKGKSEKLFRNITPQGYGDIKTNLKRYKRYKNDLGRDKEDTLWYSAEESPTGKPIYYNNNLPKRDDMFRLYLGLNQKNNSFVPQYDYKPSKSKDADALYWKPNYWNDEMKQELLNNYFFKNWRGYEEHKVYNERERMFRPKLDSLKKAGVDWSNPETAEWVADNPLGDFTVTKGEDDKGKYISVYDKIDFNPFQTGKGSSVNPAALALKMFMKSKGYDVDEDTEAASLLGAGKPYEIYDRIYYDDKTKKITKFRNGGTVSDPPEKKLKNRILKEYPGFKSILDKTDFYA
ncbi:MAG: hypothetical protein ACW981_21675, partial [Candidatus Hodarchaeales archaeon]